MEIKFNRQEPFPQGLLLVGISLLVIGNLLGVVFSMLGFSTSGPTGWIVLFVFLVPGSILALASLFLDILDEKKL